MRVDGIAMEVKRINEAISRDGKKVNDDGYSGCAMYSFNSARLDVAFVQTKIFTFLSSFSLSPSLSRNARNDLDE